MDRKSWIQMIVTIAVVLAAFFALQTWLAPKRAPADNTAKAPANTPAEAKDPPKVSDPSPGSQRTSEPTAAEKERGFDPMRRSQAATRTLANERLTAVFSERGGALDSLTFINAQGEPVFLKTPDDPTIHPSEGLELISPSDDPKWVAAFALKLDDNDALRNTSRWEAGAVTTDSEGHQSVTFRFPPAGKLESDGTAVVKRFTLRKGSYRIDAEVEIENHSDKSLEKVVGLWGPPGITNDNIKNSGDYSRVALYGSTENKRWTKDKGGASVHGFQSTLGDYNEDRADEGKSALDAVDSVWQDSADKDGMFLIAHGLRTRYFLAFFASDPDVLSTQHSGHIKPWRVGGENVAACSLMAPKLDVGKAAGGAPGKAKARLMFYAGPRDKAALEQAWDVAPAQDDEQPNHWAELAPPGWPWIVTAPLAWLLKSMSGVMGPGLAVIVLTLIVRMLLSPLSFKGQKSMAIYTKKMKVVKPRLDALKEKYASRKDRDGQLAMLQETRDIMRSENVGFFPFGGCLPVLMQMPIFIGLYQTFANSFFLRQAGFAWLHDLSLPDATIPFSLAMHWLPGFLQGFLTHNGIFTINLLPMAWIALSVIQMKMQPKPDDPQQAAMQKQMGCIFPIMGLMFYSFASGFALYFIVSSLYSLAETKIIKRYLIAKGIVDPPKPKSGAGEIKPAYHVSK